MKIILVHPEPMPCIRNRAVFQRPLMFSENSRLTIISMVCNKICHDISKGAFKVVYLNGGRRWKLELILWLYRNRSENINSIIYAFPQWGFISLYLAKKLGYKVVVDMQHTPYYYYYYNLITPLPIFKKFVYKVYGAVFFIVAKLILKKYDLVVAMAHSSNTGFAKILHENFYVPFEKIYALPNGVEINNENKFLIKTFKDIRLCYVGNIQKSKMIELLELCDMLANVKLEYRIYIAGKVAPIFKKEFSEMLSLNSKIEYLGVLEHIDLIDLYKKCNFGFFTVNDEFIDHKYSHPGKVYEYMLYGCIPIVSKIPSLEFFIKDKYNGFFMDEDIISKLLNVVGEGSTGNDMLINAFDSVSDFNWSQLNSRLFKKLSKM
jgi:hypothetical protein